MAVNKKVSRQKKPFYKRKGFWWPIGIVLGIVLVILLAFRVSPWPGALVIRAVFENNGAKMLKAMEKHPPNVPVTRLADQQYRPGDPDALLDVYYAEAVGKTDKKQPVVVWTHGGAWLSGSKDNDVPYFKLLAAQGITVVAPNYTLAPAATYPTAVRQLNDAHAYILANADKFHADTNNILLAGDSAGSQLSSQLAALVTNPDYAREVAITPSLKPEQLKGVVLFCGIYKMEGLTQPDPTLPKIVGWGDDVSVWAYSGTKDFSDPVIRQMSAYYHVTKDFPPTFISGGNADPLTNAQSKPLAENLQSLGVSVETLFYPTNHQPALPHEYQFNLDNQDGQNALKETVEFITSKTTKSVQ
jgi:acetyl esterase/lipase